MNHNYTEEEIKDVKERQTKAFEMLKELQLAPAATTFTDKVGKTPEGYDIFGIGVAAFLQDTKYSNETTKEA